MQILFNELFKIILISILRYSMDILWIDEINKIPIRRKLIVRQTIISIYFSIIWKSLTWNKIKQIPTTRMFLYSIYKLISETQQLLLLVIYYFSFLNANFSVLAVKFKMPVSLRVSNIIILCRVRICRQFNYRYHGKCQFRTFRPSIIFRYSYTAVVELWRRGAIISFIVLI